MSLASPYTVLKTVFSLPGFVLLSSLFSTPASAQVVTTPVSDINASGGVSADGRGIYVNVSQSTQGSSLNFQTFPLNPASLRAIKLDEEIETIPINPGLNGAWFEPETAGQGFFIDVIASQNQLFAGWFAYETDQGIVLGEGENAHRWAVLQGPYENGVATLDVFLAEGGLFDDPSPVTTTTSGTATLTFSSCTTATFEYALDSGLNGDIQLIRLTPDVFCTDLAAASTNETIGESR